MDKLNLYYIDEEYISYLRKFDSRVSYNKRTTRPYLGVVFKHNDFYYFAPLSSPKPKHLGMSNNKIDVFKIDDGKLGVININNMIPTPLECLTKALPQVKDKTYKYLLSSQLDYINKHRKELFNKIDFFVFMYQSGKLKSIENRCCDFKLLEDKCLEYKVDVKQEV